jgi:hypothetical protein
MKANSSRKGSAGRTQVLTAIARSRVQSWLTLHEPAPNGHNAYGVPLESWVLRPSTCLGRLDSWFSGEPVGTRYRVMVHHAPARYGSVDLPVLWDGAHGEFHRQYIIQHRQVTPDALRDAASVLQEWLVAYR